MNDVRHLTEDEAQLLLEDCLSESDAARVAAHVAACPHCEAMVASFQALSEALSALPVAEPPADFTAGVMARIEEQESVRAAERRVTAAVLGTVAASIVAALAIAGQSAWAPALSAASSAAVQLLQAVRISTDVLSPVVSALRLQIIVGVAAVGIPLFLAIARLSAPRHGHQAA